jgi:prepilin peptidase CpaA
MSEIPSVVVWYVSGVLVLAAVIDGLQLRVPNWLTFPFAATGLVYAAVSGGWWNILWSLGGAGVGLICLLTLYSIGGMGAGDVKLMAGVGAWMGPVITFKAFVGTALVGGLMGGVMILASGELIKHWEMFQTIAFEILTVRNPVKLAESAGERKKSMMLLPYGIPIAVGSIACFGWMGLF